MISNNQKVLTGAGRIGPLSAEIIQQSELEIVDQAAFESYTKLNESPILNKKKIYTSKKGTDYHLNSPAFQLEKKAAAEGMGEEELKKLLTLRKLYNKTSLKRGQMMKKAFGAKVMVEGQEVKLSTVYDQRRSEIIELFGRMFSLKEVYEVCVTKFKMKGISVNGLKSYRSRNAEEIQRKIEQFKTEFTDMRLAIKRGRLEELCWMYNKRKKIYELTNRPEDHKILLSTLEQIRKEAEGDALRLEGNVNLTVDAVIENQVQKNIMNHLNIKEIALSRIIGRSSASVATFLAMIQKNWYTKTFDQSIEDIEHEDLNDNDFPSTKPYDFELITRVNKQAEQKQQALAAHGVTEEVGHDPAISKQGLSLKQLLLKKLQEKETEVRAAKDNVDMNSIEELS